MSELYVIEKSESNVFMDISSLSAIETSKDQSKFEL